MAQISSAWFGNGEVFVNEGFANEKFLVPDLLPKDEPYTGEWKLDECLCFEYHYNILPGSVMSRFIVRTNDLIYRNTCWRNGVVLTYGECLALVKADPEERSVVVRISGRPERRREFLATIRSHFNHIHKTISKLEIKEKVPIPGNSSVIVDYNHLLTLEELGQDMFIPEGLREMVSVRRLLEGIEGIRAGNESSNRESLAISKSDRDKTESTVISEAEELKHIKIQLNEKAQRQANKILWFYLSALVITGIILVLLTYYFTWNVMEPWTYFVGLSITIGAYTYFAITQRELSPSSLYNHLVENKRRKLYIELGLPVDNKSVADDS